MKKYVELVKKFLADDTSVSLEELKVNEKAAYAVWANTDDAWAGWASAAALWSYRAAYWADNLENTEYYKQKAIKAIAEYEELTK